MSDPERADNSRENRAIWSSYAWPEGGDEWSNPWGGTRALWHGFILPRIQSFLPHPAGSAPDFRALEIAPGHGRCTQFLVERVPHLVLVDLVEECLEHCRKRFAAYSHVEYFCNDGSSLAMLEDESIDFAFSWDSLVHVDHGPLRAYVFELARVLRPGGVAFLHHSNLGEQAHELGDIDPYSTLGNRRVSVSATAVAQDCVDAGLRCRVQELMAWNDPHFYSDCLSLIEKAPPAAGSGPRVLRRTDFGQEVALIRRTSEHYRPG